MNNFICKICGKEYPVLLSLSKHLTKNHKYNGGLLQYYIDYENFQIPKCLYCDKKSKHEIGLNFNQTCCSVECLHKSRKSIRHSNESKLKISEKLIKAYKEGRNRGWSFINSDINRRSYPEKWFIKNVLKRYNLYEKHTIKEKLSFGKYFLDFAILDMKIDIEIDGQQHFRTIEAINHDKERDNFLLNNDWKVYRIAWIELKNNSDIIINDFLIWILKNKLYRKYNVDELIKILDKNRNRNKKYKNRKDYFLNKKIQYDLKQIPITNKVLESDIDFSKQGWVKKVSKIIGISDNKGGNWMKRNMNDFYNKNCFKRNYKCIDTVRLLK